VLPLDEVEAPRRRCAITHNNNNCGNCSRDGSILGEVMKIDNTELQKRIEEARDERKILTI